MFLKERKRSNCCHDPCITHKIESRDKQCLTPCWFCVMLICWASHFIIHDKIKTRLLSWLHNWGCCSSWFLSEEHLYLEVLNSCYLLDLTLNFLNARSYKCFVHKKECNFLLLSCGKYSIIPMHSRLRTKNDGK